MSAPSCLDWPLWAVRPIRAPGVVPIRFDYAVICWAVAFAGSVVNTVAELFNFSTTVVVLFNSTHYGL